MGKTTKRLLSLITALVMVISMMPVNALQVFAADTETTIDPIAVPYFSTYQATIPATAATYQLADGVSLAAYWAPTSNASRIQVWFWAVNETDAEATVYIVASNSNANNTAAAGASAAICGMVANSFNCTELAVGTEVSVTAWTGNSEKAVIPFVLADENGNVPEDDSATDETEPDTTEPAPTYVAVIGEQGYETLAEAITAANGMTGDVVVQIHGKAEYTDATASLTGAYDSISFVGKTDDAEISITRDGSNGYISGEGNDCTVSFTDLILSKPTGAYANDAGFMNVYFSVYRVGAVNYTDCTFPDGACAQGCPVTYTNCEFANQTSGEYSLWVYADTEVTVTGGEFTGVRGVKMYAEGAAKTGNLVMENTTFTASVTEKPAIVLTYGESVTLKGNTYNNVYKNTGAATTFELDADGDPNGTPVTSDAAITCYNDNGACGVMVDGSIYTTVADAAEVAASGSTVTLLHSTTETVELAEGVTLDTNGYTAESVTVAAPTYVAVIGEQGYDSLDAALAAAKDGDTITLQADAKIENAYDVKDMTLTIDGTGTLDLNDKLGVSGKSTLNITCPILANDKQVILHDGATLVNSTINGEVFVFGKVTFSGDNTVKMLYDFGTHTGYGQEAAQEWTVEEGGSLSITDTSRYGLGYGDKVTIYGSLENALEAREALTEEDISFFTNGISLADAWDVQNYLTIEDAYVVIGSNNSFGTKADYGNKGDFHITLNNSVLDSSRVTVVEDGGEVFFVINKSDLKAGVWHFNQVGSTATFTDSVMVLTGSGTDYPNVNAGSMTLSGTSIEFQVGDFTNNGTIEMDLGSSIVVNGKLLGSGKIVIDATGFTGVSTFSATDANGLVLIDADMSEYTGTIEVEGATYTADENGLTIIPDVAESDPSPEGNIQVGYLSADYINGIGAFFGEAIDVVANESFVVKLYAGETLVGTAELVDTEKVLLNGVSKAITWHAALADDGDSWWKTTWEGGSLKVNAIPDKIELWVDGVMVSEGLVELNINDLEKPIIAAVTDANGNVQSFVAGTGYLNGDGANAPVYDEALKTALSAGGNITLLRDVKLTSLLKVNGKSFTLEGNGNSITGTGALWLESGTYNVRNVVFENIEYTTNYGILEFNHATATVTGCTFTGNTAVNCIAVDCNTSNGTSNVTVADCTFTGNTCSSTVINLADGTVTVEDCAITGNTADIAVIYTSTDSTVTGNYFSNNTLAGTNANKADVLAGPWAEGEYTIAITGNAFLDADLPGAFVEDWADLGANNAYDLNGNYWNGGEPNYGASGDPVVTLDNYCTSCTYTDGVLTLSDAVAIAYVAQIGDTKYETLPEAIAAAEDGDTIELLSDVEITETLTVGSNSAFDKLNITINGNGYSVKAVESSSWTNKTWLADITWNVTLNDITFDGNNLGMRGVQFYTSESTLNNVTIKNVNVDLWGITDYAIHSNASELTVTGSLTFENCKYGHLVADIGASLPEGTTSTVEVAEDAVLTGVTVAAQAKVGNTYYATLVDAFAAAQKGDTITLLADVTLTEQLMINDNDLLSDVTLDGNGHTIYDAVSGASTICFGSNGYWPTGVKIKDLTVEAAEGNADPYCAIRLYGGTSSVLTNVKVVGDYTYGINFYGTHGATLDNCQIASAFTNGQAANPLNLTNGSVITTLIANDGATMEPKIFIDSTSSITTVCADDHTAMIDPNSMDRIGTILESDTELPMVASVNGVQYSTLALAIANAQAGNTVELLANITLDAMVTVPAGKTIILDLNGKTVATNFAVASGNDMAICVAYGADLTINDSVGTGVIDGSGVYGAVKLTYTGDDAANGTAKLTVNGGKLIGNYYAIAGNGSRHGTEIVINDGTLTATQDVWGYGIFHPQDGKLTVNGGTISAPTGIEMRGGELTVNGGTIESTASELTVSSSDSGTTVSGAAIALSQHNTNKAISIVVNDGTLSGPYAFYQDRLTKTYTESTNISATIGADVTVNGAVEATEGNFGMPEATDGSYTLVKYVASITSGRETYYYATLADAIADAQPGETVELLSDVTEVGSYMITDGDDITVKGNGYTINCEDGFYVTGGKLTLSEDLTVKASVYNAVYLRGGEVITSANLYAAGVYAAIQGNGSYAGDVTVNGGVIESAEGVIAIYWPQNGKLTVNGGSITGATGIYLKSGSLEITGGTITGNGAKQSYEYVASGATATGAAVVIENVGGETGYEEITSVSITGGNFVTVNASRPVASHAATAANPDAVAVKNFITGGTYNKRLATSVIHADMKASENSETGLYEIVDKVYVVSVTAADGTVTKYESITSAKSYITDGSTVTLLADVTGQVVLDSGKNVTLDLNGYEWSATYATIFVEGGASLTVQDSSEAQTGKIYSGGDVITVDDGTLTVKSGTLETRDADDTVISASYATVTIEGGKLIGAGDGVQLIYNSESAPNTFTMTGGEIDVAGYGVTGNGTYDYSTVTVSGGKISGDVVGIYHPQNGTMTITGGEITGGTGVYVKAGNVSISGDAVISGTGEAAEPDVDVNTDGTTSTGDALVIHNEGADTAYGPISVTVTGGTFTSVNGNAVASYATGEETTYDKFVADGSFNTDVSELCVEGYEATLDETTGLYGVTEKSNAVAKIGNVEYADLSDALDAAASGETVTLLQDTTETILVVHAGTVLDLNGNTVTVASGVLGYGEVKDSTDGTGLIKISSDMIVDLMDDNSQMPLYDTENGGYRLFNFQAYSMGVAATSASSSRFWFTIIFDNMDAYTLLADSVNAGLTMTATVEWTDMTGSPVTVAIKESSIAQWIDSVESYKDQILAGQYQLKQFGVYVGVGGIDTLEAGDVVTVTPSFSTKGGVSADFTALTKEVS